MPKYGLQFDLVETSKQIAELGDFMRSNVGPYDAARHDEWIEETCLPGVAHDERRALAWWEHRRMVGDAVLKPLSPGVAELKNFRIKTSVSGRGMGNLMIRHACLEAVDVLRDKGLVDSGDTSITLQLDTLAGGDAQHFFERNGFRVVDAKELYTPGKLEVIMQRSIPLN